MNLQDARIAARALNLDGGEGSGVRGHTTERGGIHDIHSKFWDVEKAAREMGRHEFTAHFVARQTRKAENRGVTNGYQVVKKGSDFHYTQAGTGVHLSNPTRDHGKFYDMIRRTPLNHYVRQAEDFRAEVLG